MRKRTERQREITTLASSLAQGPSKAALLLNQMSKVMHAGAKVVELIVLTENDGRYIVEPAKIH